MVEISEEFYISLIPVTQDQWEVLIEYNPSRFNGADKPIAKLFWNEAAQYLAAYNPCSVGTIQGTTQFNPTKRHKNLRGLDVDNRPFSHPGEHVKLKAP